MGLVGGGGQVDSRPLFLPGSWRAEQLGSTPLASRLEPKPDGTPKSREGKTTPQMDADQQSYSIFVHIRAPVTSGSPVGGGLGREGAGRRGSHRHPLAGPTNRIATSPPLAGRGPRKAPSAEGRRGSPSQGLRAAWLALGAKPTQPEKPPLPPINQLNEIEKLN